MRTYSLDLLFKGGEGSNSRGPTRSHVYVKSWTTRGDARPLLSSECLSLSELEGEIDRLKGELEEIRKKARHEYAKP